MKTLVRFFQSIANACPYSLAAKKGLAMARGEKTARPQNAPPTRKFEQGIKMGRNIALVGVFCPFLWYSILSGKSREFILLNLIHSGIIAGLGVLLMLINLLALVYNQKKNKN